MSSFPEWLVPMAATLTQERFTGPEWIFERKFDGIRLLAFKQGADVRLFSRNRLPQNIPAIAEAIAKLPVRDVILDGEITWDRQRRLPRVRHPVARRAQRDVAAARRAPGAAARNCRFARRCGGSRPSTMPSRGSARAARDGKA